MFNKFGYGGSIMLKLESICFSYEKQNKILKNISLDIKKGAKTVFLGENGSGKSTLFFLLNGLLKPDSGEIYFNGEKLKYKKKDLENLRKKVGIVFQDPEVQIFAPTVYQEMAYGLQNLNYSNEKIEEKISEISTDLNMKKILEKPCHHLSYGQKKRVTIASILAMEPEILVLDEPTAWLDFKNIKKTLEMIENLCKRGKTLVISTHDIDFAYEVADYIYILNEGQIVKQGTRYEIFEDFKFLKKLNLDVPKILKVKEFLKQKNIDILEYYEFLEKNFK